MKTDYLIIGGGIIGLTVAYYLQQKYPNDSILIIDKEADIALHASGRNSGVLHAGLYYANNSLRAKYCRLGASKIRNYCIEKNIMLNNCGKVIVATNDNEVNDLRLLYQNALKNNVEVKLVDEIELSVIEPSAKTIQHALYSPNTASFHAEAICSHLKNDLKKNKVKFKFFTQFQKRINDNCVSTNNGSIEYGFLINCAGAYADKIAKCYGLAERYTLIPFRGIFLCMDNLTGKPLTHIYSPPNQKLKLLGVHLSPEYNGKIKIGPTAMPCLSRENYHWLSNLHFNEMKEIITTELRLLISNSFNFRDVAINELKKQTKFGLIMHAKKLVKNINSFRAAHWGAPGILPRLYDLKQKQIIDDFLIETGANSVHVINSVSPAFTASFAFSEHIVNSFL